MAAITGFTPLEGGIAELNRNGIRLLIAGGDNLQKCLLSFSTSFALLEESLSMKNGNGQAPFLKSITAMYIQDTSAGGPYPRGGNASNCSLSESNNSKSNETPRDSYWDHERGVPHLASEQLFIYHKPIEFFADDHHLFCRGALLFNISLTQHAIGLRTGDGTTLQISMMFYELAFQSFQSVVLHSQVLRIEDNQEANLQAQVYLLAAWNNQATIHLALNRRESARKMFKQQKALIQGLHQREIKDADRHTSRDETGQVSQLLQAFLMNEFIVEITALSACVA